VLFLTLHQRAGFALCEEAIESCNGFLARETSEMKYGQQSLDGATPSLSCFLDYLRRSMATTTPSGFVGSQFEFQALHQNDATKVSGGAPGVSADSPASNMPSVFTHSEEQLMRRKHHGN
jgi:hypothetical protein